MKSHSLFIALPMSSVTPQEYLDLKKKIKKLVIDLNGLPQIKKIYVAGEILESGSKFDTPAESALHDLGAITDCDLFIFIYPTPSPSSAIFEAGYAYALQKKSLYLTRSELQLPFLMRGLHRVTCASFSAWEEIVSIVQNFLK